MIETDVRLSADGELFLFHDDTGARTTNVAQVFPERANEPINSFTGAELRQLDAGGWFGEEFAGEPIVFLADLPEAVGFALGINLELKVPADSPGVLGAVAAVLESPDWVRLRQGFSVTVSSFDPAAVLAFARLAPQIPAWQLVDDIPDAALLAAGAGYLQGVVADHQYLTAAGAAAVRAAGLGLWTYTVNGEPDTDAVLALGVDAVITDFPERLVSRLAEARPAGIPVNLPAESRENGRADTGLLPVIA